MSNQDKSESGVGEIKKTAPSLSATAIPKDKTLEAARAAFRKSAGFQVNFVLYSGLDAETATDHLRQAADRLVAVAITAARESERERCAKVADSFDSQRARARGENFGEAVAKEIRNPSTQADVSPKADNSTTVPEHSRASLPESETLRMLALRKELDPAAPDAIVSSSSKSTSTRLRDGFAQFQEGYKEGYEAALKEIINRNLEAKRIPAQQSPLCRKCQHNRVGLSGHCIENLPDAYGNLKGGSLCGCKCEFSAPQESKVKVEGPSSTDYEAWLATRPELEYAFEQDRFTKGDGYEIWRNAWMNKRTTESVAAPEVQGESQAEWEGEALQITRRLAISCARVPYECENLFCHHWEKEVAKQFAAFAVRAFTAGRKSKTETEYLRGRREAVDEKYPVWQEKVASVWDEAITIAKEKTWWGDKANPEYINGVVEALEAARRAAPLSGISIPTAARKAAEKIVDELREMLITPSHFMHSKAPQTCIDDITEIITDEFKEEG